MACETSRAAAVMGCEFLAFLAGSTLEGRHGFVYPGAGLTSTGATAGGRGAGKLSPETIFNCVSHFSDACSLPAHGGFMRSSLDLYGGSTSESHLLERPLKHSPLAH